MKKAVQYSDKYGKIVADGEKPAERTAPGVTMKAAEPKAKVEEPKAEVKSEEPKAEKPKATKEKAAKKTEGDEK